MQHVVGQVGEVGRAPDHGGEVGDGPVVERDGGHDLLGEDVERVAGVAGVLDEPVVHALDDDGRLDQVVAVLGEHLAAARLADLVTGAPDALQPTRHRARRLDLDHEVDGAHVDAELERRRGDEAAQAPGLEVVLDLEAALARQRPVVGLHQLEAGLGRGAGALGGAAEPVEVELVEPGGQALGQAAGVDEDQGGAVLEDQLEQAGVHGRPDRPASGGRTGVGAGGFVDRLAQRAHVVDGDDDLDLERLAHPGVDDLHGTGAAAAVGQGAVAAEEAGDLVERTLGGRQADALHRRWPPASAAPAGPRPAAAAPAPSRRDATSASSRSRVRARWAPRLVAASAWISSMITASTPASVSRAADVSIR